MITDVAGKPLKVRNNRRFATSPHSEFLPQARRLPENGSHSRPNGSSAQQSNLQIRQSMHEARQGGQTGTLNGWRSHHQAQTIPTPPKQTANLVRGQSCPSPDTDGHSQGNAEQRHASKDVTAVLNHASALMQGHMPIKQPPQTVSHLQLHLTIKASQPWAYKTHQFDIRFLHRRTCEFWWHWEHNYTAVMVVLICLSPDHS